MSEILTKEKVQRMRSKGERGAHLWPHQVGELCDSHEALRAQVADYEQRGVNDTDLGSVLRRAIEAQGPGYGIHDGVLIARHHLEELSSCLEARRTEVETLSRHLRHIRDSEIPMLDEYAEFCQAQAIEAVGEKG